MREKMARPNQAQEQTMEEILASIRRIISDDEARGPNRPPAGQEPSRPLSNVSHLFAEPLTPQRSHNVVELPGAEREPSMITEAFAQAMEAEDEPEPDYAPPRPRIAAPPLPDPAPDRRTPPLLSPRTDAAVNAAFAQLTDTLFNGKTRTIDGVVEDMLRPMLKTWLDNNLPPLVERMVREEIERVSRGRR
jgi:cell pole-organizing protein PopZ